MVKQTNAAARAKATPAKAAPQPATPAPAAPATWPVGWHSNGSAKAWPTLLAAGACLVRMPANGVLHNAISGLVPAAPAATLPALLAGVQQGWPAFNVGYLCGGRASYSACAAQTCGKKAKANPAFVWAVAPATPGAAPTLYTQTGAVWQAPPAPKAGQVCRTYAAYTAALQAATVAFTPAT